jgi:hypothetical protein
MPPRGPRFGRLFPERLGRRAGDVLPPRRPGLICWPSYEGGGVQLHQPCGAPWWVSTVHARLAGAMRIRGLIDTGAMLALLDRDERWHKACVQAFAQILPSRELSQASLFISSTSLYACRIGRPT